jgi:hypothetical protein
MSGDLAFSSANGNCRFSLSLFYAFSAASRPSGTSRYYVSAFHLRSSQLGHPCADGLAPARQGILVVAHAHGTAERLHFQGKLLKLHARLCDHHSLETRERERDVHAANAAAGGGGIASPRELNAPLVCFVSVSAALMVLT